MSCSGFHPHHILSRLVLKLFTPSLGTPRLNGLECPLTLAAQLEGCAELIKVLKSGGAHLDFRTKDGITALHRAVRTKNHTALITLLDLGASPDYKDSRGLTPLYHSSMVGGDPYCCELLLHDHAQVGCVDENGWQEIHQACRHGHVQHLEHLLFYGADMSSQNASGNTALHVCALYNQDSCTRVLLFRGANKEIKNYNSQTAFQVAIIAGNFDLAEIIKIHKVSDVVPFRETPTFAARRRALAGPLPSPRSLLRSASDNNLNGDHGDHGLGHAPREGRGRHGPSPGPSLRSLPALGQKHCSLGESRHGEVPESSIQSTGSSWSSHSRSPSLHHAQDEDRPVPRRSHSHGHPHGHSPRGRLRRRSVSIFAFRTAQGDSFSICAVSGTNVRPGRVEVGVGVGVVGVVVEVVVVVVEVVVVVVVVVEVVVVVVEVVVEVVVVVVEVVVVEVVVVVRGG
ncbi:unnamed protein product [Arctogadus glacialis]